MNNPSRNRSFNIALYVAGVLLFQEFVIRVCFPLPELSNLDRINYMVLMPSENHPAFLRDKNWYWESLPDTNAIFEHEMNRYGFRDKEWVVEKPAGKKRVLFVGDSFIEGVMAEQEETIPIGFNTAAGDEYDVMNGGMMGVGLNSYLQFIIDMVPIYQPDVVFLVIFANDMPTKDPIIPSFRLEAAYYPFFKLRIWELIEQAIAGNPVTIRWSNKRESFLPAVSEPNNPWTKREQLLKPHVKQEIANAMKLGRFNCFKVNQIVKEQQVLQQPVSIKKPLKFLKNFLKNYDTEMVVFYIPARHQVTNYYYPFEKTFCQLECPPEMDLTGAIYQVHQKILGIDCKELQLPFYDLTELVKKAEASNNHLYWDYDEHMRGEGYLMLGKEIHERWKDLER